MPLFESSRFIPLRMDDFSSVASDVAAHFRAKGYEAVSNQLLNGAWHISLSKGNMFKAVLGMKSALNIEIQPSSTGTLVTAGVGIFGQQAIPAAISIFFFWPVLIPQIWGIIQQSNLDDEAVTLIEQRIAARAGAASGSGASEAQSAQFCVACGQALPVDSKFCLHCGVKLA